MKMKNRVRIIQTFWSGGRDPLSTSYGWAHPEYNLMSWAPELLVSAYYEQIEL